MRLTLRTNGRTQPLSAFAQTGKESIQVRHVEHLYACSGRRKRYLCDFDCRYRELYLFDDAGPSRRRDHLWDRDVVEVFLQADRSQLYCYKEFEVAPNGLWIDLDVSSGVLRDLNSNLQCSAAIDAENQTWAAELAIPMRSITPTFDPSLIWFVNFFRVEGRPDQRTYYAWRATNTLTPNFHVPSAFGRMRFSAATK